MYERGYSDGELISFSTCSCVLWQKEQRNGSSVLSFLNGVSPLRRSSPTQTSRLKPLTWSQLGSREDIPVPRIILGPFTFSVHRRVRPVLTDWNALAVLGNDLVDQSIILCLRRGHDEIALDVLLQRVQRMPAVLRQQTIDDRAHAQNLFRVNIDIGGLPGQ